MRTHHLEIVEIAVSPDRDLIGQDWAKIAIAAERFDPSVRDELRGFFERCFARDVSARFGSAEDMRHAWVSILGAPARSQKSTKSVESSAAEEGTEETAQERVSDETLAAILADTPIATLPLSVRARNALDRAGLTKMIDMLALGSNRLSAVRGVGRQVAKEILELRDRWQALRTVSAAEVPPFFPGYAGEDFHVSMVSLGRELAAGLLEGGLPTLRAVAQAPSSQVEHLAKVHAFDLAAVRKTLAAENEKASDDGGEIDRHLHVPIVWIEFWWHRGMRWLHRVFDLVSNNAWLN